MKNSYLLTIIINLFICLTSCTSDDSMTESEMISSKTWMIESKILSPSIVYGGIEITDIMILESEETRNYSFKFDEDGTFYQYDAEGVVLYQTTWMLSADSSQIIFGDPIVYDYPVVGDMGFSTIDIVSISATKIVGTVGALFGDVDYELTITFI